MVRGLGGAIAFEVRKAPVGSAVGMAHNKNAFTLMQADGHANLLEDEVLFKVIARRGQRFGASRNHDHVRPFNSLLFQKLSDGGADAMVETGKHGRLGDVRFSRRIEMEDLAHGSSQSIVAGGVKRCSCDFDSGGVADRCLRLQP